MNKLILMGRLTRDPELRHTHGGTALAKFGIAVDSYAGRGEDGETKKRTLFLDCVAFGKTGENVNQYFRKGHPILLEGELVLEQWEKDGQKRSKHSMRVESFQFIPSVPAENEESRPAPTSTRTERTSAAKPNRSAKPSGGDTDYGDIPF